MTREQAEKVVTELQGWDDPRIEEGDWGDCVVTAVEPITQRRMEYDPTTGQFT
jgi:RNA polymerase-binding transcription factor DksA